MKKFIRELQRREVFRTAGLYIGLCWIVIEASSVLLPTFDAPEWILRAIVILAIIGFPVTIILAWIYDVTDQGIEVQAEPTDTIVAQLGGRKTDFLVIGVLTVALVFSIYLNVTREGEYVEPPDPVAALIADFDNQTGDPLFDGSLEQAFQIGVEAAPFITTYARTDAREVAEDIRPGSALDLDAARLVSVRENIGMVLSGSIVPEGSGYTLTMTAIEPQEGAVITEIEAEARNKGEVLMAVGLLASDLMEELGGQVLEEEIAFATDSFTASSLEAVKSYTTAQDLQGIHHDEEAIEYYAKAVEQDPNFTRAYSGWALSAFNLGRTEEADEVWEKALANLDRVTDRERLRTLGLYYSLVTRNYPKAIESYQSLVDRYPADDIGHNNLAVLHFLSLNFDAALTAGRNVLEIYPGSAMYQTNYALFAMYASDFEVADAEARKVLDEQPGYYKAWLPLAVSALVNDDVEAATRYYASMRDASEQGESTAVLGLADTAIYAGDFAAAREILQDGIELGTATGNLYGTTTAHMAIAYSWESEGDLAAAAAAARQGLEVGAGEPWVVQAALTYLAAGDTDAAAEIAATLMQELHPQSRAYGFLIDGLLAGKRGATVESIERLSAALDLADLWLIRFYLGRVYLEAGYHAEALDEFTICYERRGEAASLFLDDLPTYRYVAPLHYWLARAQQELGMTTAATANYEAFLALRPDGGALVGDAAERLK